MTQVQDTDSDIRITRWADIRTAEYRKYAVERTGCEHPSSIVHWIECPWCGVEVKAYLWSLAGGGKRCRCGAIFASGGHAWKRQAKSSA